MKRYDLIRGTYAGGTMEESEDGDWVRYDDAIEAIEQDRKKQEILFGRMKRLANKYAIEKLMKDVKELKG